MISKIIESGRYTLQLEADALLAQIDLLGNEFEEAVKLIATSNGKLVVTGMGKSGIIGKKIAATLASTGTPSFFMHPGEAYHGDLGMVTKNDLILALSNSGETDEILKIIPFFKDNQNKIISITSKQKSTLAKHSDIHLYIKIDKEACPLELAPTSSTTVTLAMGDALAVSLMKLKNFKSENFARFHPGGALGRQLLVKVKDVMRSKDLPCIKMDSMLSDVIDAIGKGRLGLALVMDNDDEVNGIITDGDLRRILEQHAKSSFDLKANEMMQQQPKTILNSSPILEAEMLFNQYKINSLIVVNEEKKLQGIIQIYDVS
jgi:arabinose-5-phosphate isomerase